MLVVVNSIIADSPTEKMAFWPTLSQLSVLWVSSAALPYFSSDSSYLSKAKKMLAYANATECMRLFDSSVCSVIVTKSVAMTAENRVVFGVDADTPLGLECLVAEEFHGFVVDKRVDRSLRGLSFGGVHRLPHRNPPIRHLHREH